MITVLVFYHKASSIVNNTHDHPEGHGRSCIVRREIPPSLVCSAYRRRSATRRGCCRRNRSRTPPVASLSPAVVSWQPSPTWIRPAAVSSHKNSRKAAWRDAGERRISRYAICLRGNGALRIRRGSGCGWRRWPCGWRRNCRASRGWEGRRGRAPGSTPR